MLNDLLHLTDEEIRRTKIRCCIDYDSYNPAEEFKRNPDMFNTEWVLARKKNKNGNDAERLHKGWKVVGLARLPIDKDLWVVTCVKHISNTLDRPEKDNGLGFFFCWPLLPYQEDDSIGKYMLHCPCNTGATCLQKTSRPLKASTGINPSWNGMKLPKNFLRLM